MGFFEYVGSMFRRSKSKDSPQRETVKQAAADAARHDAREFGEVYVRTFEEELGQIFGNSQQRLLGNEPIDAEFTVKEDSVELPDLDTLKRHELIREAKRRGLSYKGQPTKAHLIKLLS